MLLVFLLCIILAGALAVNRRLLDGIYPTCHFGILGVSVSDSGASSSERLLELPLLVDDDPLATLTMVALVRRYWATTGTLEGLSRSNSYNKKRKLFVMNWGKYSRLPCH